ncbi:uncharacterized protein FA14DRAFT_185611 [Meira miltonrushii]|uniref:Uncharacterized protein n=1 Tax=Meira miltonrushii TaxID=1280837 RepID=A0A316V5N2_9BASI|nr:uncharacterized protein FA14DRAFT_185611 [Meira miltonrushii]PWN32534.1 hypothetical protein FA14DRAFT_185611 [Meira miltonrushii]
MKTMVFFLSFLAFNAIAYVASTSRELRYHNAVKDEYAQLAHDSGLRKVEWQARRDTAPCPRFKQHCQSYVEHYERQQKEDADVSRKAQEKADLISLDIVKRRKLKDNKEHKQLIEQVQERPPKGNIGHKRTRSYR